MSKFHPNIFIFLFQFLFFLAVVVIVSPVLQRKKKVVLPVTSGNVTKHRDVIKRHQTSSNVVTAGCDSLHHLPNQCGDRRTKNCQIVKSFYIKNNKSMSGSLETYFWGLLKYFLGVSNFATFSLFLFHLSSISRF